LWLGAGNEAVTILIHSVNTVLYGFSETEEHRVGRDALILARAGVRCCVLSKPFRMVILNAFLGFNSGKARVACGLA
jgi:hypothetical protein